MSKDELIERIERDFTQVRELGKGEDLGCGTEQEPFSVWLKVGVQSFGINGLSYSDKSEAEWMAHQLAVGLAGLVTEIDDEDVFAFLKRRAEGEGITNVSVAIKRFMKAGSNVLASPQKRKAIPRAWVEAAFIRQKGKCADCPKRLQLFDSNADDYATGDHSEAHNGGGEHSKRNTRAVCQSCNSSKGDRDPVEYAKTSGHLMSNLVGGED